MIRFINQRCFQYSPVYTRSGKYRINYSDTLFVWRPPNDCRYEILGSLTWLRHSSHPHSSVSVQYYSVPDDLLVFATEPDSCCVTKLSKSGQAVSKAHRDGDPGEISSDLYSAFIPDIRPSWWVFTKLFRLWNAVPAYLCYYPHC